MVNRRRLSSTPPLLRKYILVTTFSILLSTGGLFFAVRLKCPSLAGWGGGLATALAFGTLFVRKDLGLKIYAARMKFVPKTASDLERVRLQAEAIVAAMEINSDGQRNQNIALAIASVTGTLFWTFGEAVAKQLISHR